MLYSHALTSPSLRARPSLRSRPYARVRPRQGRTRLARRAFFSGPTTQHVPSARSVAREVLRIGLALANAAAWLGLAFLLTT